MLGNLGAADIDSRLEEQLIDGILFAFQEQTSEVSHSLSLSHSLFTYLLPPPGRYNVERIWCGGQRSRHACQTLPSSNLWNYLVETQQ